MESVRVLTSLNKASWSLELYVVHKQLGFKSFQALFFLKNSTKMLLL